MGVVAIEILSLGWFVPNPVILCGALGMGVLGFLFTVGRVKRVQWCVEGVLGM